LPDYILRYFDDGEWKTNSGSKVLSYSDWQAKLGKASVVTENAEKGFTNARESGIIKLRVNLFDKSDPLHIESVLVEEEDGFEDVCLHGCSEFVQTKIDGKLKNFNAKEFAEFLKQNAEYRGGDIRLASCSTGKGDNSFAQQLSKELGVTVKAPDDDLYYVVDHYLIGSRYTNMGKWRVFRNGVEVE